MLIRPVNFKLFYTLLSKGLKNFYSRLYELGITMYIFFLSFNENAFCDIFSRWTLPLFFFIVKEVDHFRRWQQRDLADTGRSPRDGDKGWRRGLRRSFVVVYQGRCVIGPRGATRLCRLARWSSDKPEPQELLTFVG